MLKTVIKQNSYQDSINLMLLTNQINTLEGVAQSQIMMGTDANKDIFSAAGLLTEEAKNANPSDMVIVVETEDDAVMDTVLAEAESFLADLSVKKTVSGAPSEASSWEEAVAMLPNANMALFSIPGEFAAPELERALDLGLNVFSFTDNVALEDEVRLKQKAHMAEVIDELNAVKPSVGFDKVHWPGERAQMRIQATKDAGGIEIVDSIYEYLKSDELYIHSWDHKNRFAE